MYIYTPLCRYWIALYRHVLVFIVPHVDIELEDNKQFISNIPHIYIYIYLLNVVIQIIISSVLQIWYVEVRISQSISESPLEFKITRVDCII